MSDILEEGSRIFRQGIGVTLVGGAAKMATGVAADVYSIPDNFRARVARAQERADKQEERALAARERLEARQARIEARRDGQSYGYAPVGYSGGMTRQERNAFAREEQQYNASMANYNKDIIQAIGQNLILAQNLPVGDQRRQAYVDQAMAAAQNLVKDGGFIVEPITGRAQTATVDIGIDGQSFRYTSRKSDNFQDNKRLVEDIAKDAARQIGGTPIHFSELGLPDAAPQASVTPSRQGSVSAYTHALAKRESSAQLTPAVYVPSGNSLPLGSMGGVNPKEQAAAQSVTDAIVRLDAAQGKEAFTPLAASFKDTVQKKATQNVGGSPLFAFTSDVMVKVDGKGEILIPKGDYTPKDLTAFLTNALGTSPATVSAINASLGATPAKAPPVNTPPAASKADATQVPATGGNTKTVFNPDAQAPAKVQTSSAPAAAPAAAAPKVDQVTITAAGDAPAKPYLGTKGKLWNPSDMPKIAANQVEEIQKMLGVKVDGKWGPDTHKAFAKICDNAGIKDTRTVDFTNPKNPELIALMNKLDATKVARVEVAPAVQTIASPLTNAATVAPVTALETVAPVAVASAPAVTIPELAPAPAPMPASSASVTAAVQAGDELETIAVTMARAAQQGIAPTQAQLERVNDLLKERGDDAPGALASIAKKLEALGLEQAQPNQAPVEQSAPAVVPTPAPVIQQTAFVPAAAANEPSPFATASFGFGAASFGDNAPAPVSFGGQEVNLEQAIAQARNAPAAGSVSAEFRSAPPAPNAGFDEKSMQRT